MNKIVNKITFVRHAAYHFEADEKILRMMHVLKL